MSLKVIRPTIEETLALLAGRVRHLESLEPPIREHMEFPDSIHANAVITVYDLIPVVLLDSGEYCNWINHLPADFTTIDELVIVHYPDTTQQIQYDIWVYTGATGEAWPAQSDNAQNQLKNVIADQLDEIDISGVFPAGTAADDYMAAQFRSDTNTLRVVGLRMRYH